MNVRRCLIELAKEVDWIAEVGSCNDKIDDASDKLPISCRLTLCGAREAIKF